ncbi:hypothetical protein [Rhodopseudomonas pseudopalustris]|uniref:Uncharacterized protein n=1 Tax=Rhodopseudomonas pseudopalustris TaxID=1513892 RepID=A0A1H8V8C4_9BRAD|nr:hypothetical protein [Rhodopseudomonas pseudopalustris]SEP11504.1 hypothetical protein SAMN05444123_108109 [Rhodopseudomonas pseudopalustris]
MTVFTFQIDPMPALRDAAKARVDRSFNTEAAAMAHQDAAYAAKRDLAARALAGDLSELMLVEAELRGVSVADLASDILTKPETVAAREMRRQTVLAAIRNAATPAELEQVTKIYG